MIEQVIDALNDVGIKPTIKKIKPTIKKVKQVIRDYLRSYGESFLIEPVLFDTDFEKREFFKTYSDENINE